MRHAFSMGVYCTLLRFKVIMLDWIDQCNYIENITAFSKHMMKTLVATWLKAVFTLTNHACIFCIAKYFGSTCLGWPNQDKHFENAIAMGNACGNEPLTFFFSFSARQSPQTASHWRTSFQVLALSESVRQRGQMQIPVSVNVMTSYIGVTSLMDTL